MQTTAKPATPLEKSTFGASVLAWIISAKCERHLPLYRQQEMLLEPLAIWLSRPLLAGLLRGSAQVLQPLVARALDEILLSWVIQADVTLVKYHGAGGDAQHDAAPPEAHRAMTLRRRAIVAGVVS